MARRKLWRTRFDFPGALNHRINLADLAEAGEG